MTPAGTPNELDVQNEWEENTHTHIHNNWEDQCEWHRMTRMTRPDCAVMCNLINTHTHTHTLCNSILLLPCVMVYYIVSILFLLFFWYRCMAINVSVQYNGGLLPDIILLTQCYFHRRTRLNSTMKRFCICSL